MVLEIFSSLDDSIIMLDDEKKGLSSTAHGLLGGVCFTAVPPSERGGCFLGGRHMHLQFSGDRVETMNFHP